MTAPIPKVQRVVPRCRVCGNDADLIVADGPPVCHPCVKEAGAMGRATVRRSDTPRRRR